MKYYLKVCLMIVFFAGCVNSKAYVKVEKLDVSYGKQIPEEVKVKINKNVPQYVSFTTFESAGLARTKADFYKGNGALHTEPNTGLVLDGLTNGAMAWKIVGDIFNEGFDVFSSSVQGYYRGKTQDIKGSTTTVTTGSVTQNN